MNDADKGEVPWLACTCSRPVADNAIHRQPVGVHAVLQIRFHRLWLVLIISLQGQAHVSTRAGQPPQMAEEQARAGMAALALTRRCGSHGVESSQGSRQQSREREVGVSVIAQHSSSGLAVTGIGRQAGFFDIRYLCVKKSLQNLSKACQLGQGPS